jgi:hypothetical protein
MLATTVGRDIVRSQALRTAMNADELAQYLDDPTGSNAAPHHAACLKALQNIYPLNENPSQYPTRDAFLAQKVRMQGTRRRPYVDMAKPSNATDALFGRNPSGRGYFFPSRRYSSLVWNHQTSLLAPGTTPLLPKCAQRQVAGAAASAPTLRGCTQAPAASFPLCIRAHRSMHKNSRHRTRAEY